MPRQQRLREQKVIMSGTSTGKFSSRGQNWVILTVKSGADVMKLWLCFVSTPGHLLLA